jgi:Glycosyltransferase Family 4
VRVAFDSRPGADPHGVGTYSRCLLRALRATAHRQTEIVETHRPRNADVFHAPWIEGAMLRSPCPMVVTLHDLAALKRRSERLRGGGMHLRLRQLAVQRAMRVIVPSEAIACEALAELGLQRERVVVIPEASEAAGILEPGEQRALVLAGQESGPPANLPSPTAFSPAPPSWSWEDAADATWGVYEQAIALACSERSAGRGRRRRSHGHPSASA